jgi:hypothetical protein
LAASADFGLEVGFSDPVADGKVDALGCAEVLEVGEQIDYGYIGDGGIVAARPQGGSEGGACRVDTPCIRKSVGGGG